MVKRNVGRHLPFRPEFLWTAHLMVCGQQVVRRIPFPADMSIEPIALFPREIGMKAEAGWDGKFWFILNLQTMDQAIGR